MAEIDSTKEENSLSNPQLVQMLRLPKNINFVEDYKVVLPFYSHTRNGDALSEKSRNYWIQERKVNTCIYSNLFVCKCEIDGKIYDSTEHYFQMYKYPEGDKNFMRLLSSGDVAAFGQRRMAFADKHLLLLQQLKDSGLDFPKKISGEVYNKGDKANPQLVVEDWDTVKISVMYKAIKAKFSQNPDLKKALLDTGEIWLVEHTKNDKQWADGNDGGGTNYLGKLLILLREDFMTGKEIPIPLEFLKAPMSCFIEYK